MLHIIRGLPGSGKSTYARSLGILHVEADMFFMRDGVYRFDRNMLWAAHQQCQALAMTAHGMGVDVAVSNTFTTMKEMEPYMKGNFIVIECRGTWPSVHNVPPDAMERMRARWEHVEADRIIGG